MMGIAFCNTEGEVVARFGGIKKVLGTNLFPLSVLGIDGHNLVLDFSSAVEAAGKVVPAGMNDEEIGSRALIDRDGKPST